MATSGPSFLNEIFILNNSKSREVEKTVQSTHRKRRLEALNNLRAEAANRGENDPSIDVNNVFFERVPEQADARIQLYLDRVQSLLIGKDTREGDRNRTSLRRMLFDRYIVDPNAIPDSYGDKKDAMVEAQKNSLDAWMTYLLSPEVYQHYPDWFRYWAFRSILKMGKLDQDAVDLAKRDRPKRTWSPFPDLNQEALSFVLGAMTARLETTRRAVLLSKLTFRDDVSLEQRQNFIDVLVLEKPSFSQMYAWAFEWIKKIPDELLQITSGEWREYKGVGDAQRLVNDIKNYGTGWCIRDLGMAESYLKEESLWVYFSDESAQPEKDTAPTVPRVVVVKKPGDNGSISEVRGVAKGENLDPHITDVVKEFLMHDKHANQDAFQKRLDDTQRLQKVERKIKAGEELTRDDLVFLYEVDGKIYGFGYERDPRIAELLLMIKKDLRKHISVVLGMTEDEVALSEDELNEKTRAFVGTFSLEIIKKFRRLHFLYTSFPDGKAEISDVTLGASDPESDKRKRVTVTRAAHDMVRKSDHESNSRSGRSFLEVATQKKKPEDIRVIKVNSRALGLMANSFMYDQVLAKAKELGLSTFPAEEVLPYRRQYTDQPSGESLCVGMNPIGGNVDGYSDSPAIFQLTSHQGDLWLTNFLVSFEKVGKHTTFMFRIP